jgi:RNA polymerase sigma-70 factor (ECF subfamily)
MSAREYELIQRAIQGDPAAFTEIYERHQPAIYRYVFYRVGDVAVAEDLTAEVFVRLVERIDRFTYRGRPLLAWLYSVARNLVADHHRRTGPPREVPLDERVLATIADPNNPIQHSLTQLRLAHALSHLTALQSEVVVLKFVEGLDNRTVARLLGRSVGAIESLQHRALVALRRMMERNGR